MCCGLLVRSGAVADSVTAPPVICLNMVVRNAAHMRGDGHLLRDTLDSVAPYISSWVIVDAGSTDGTQDLIANHMASLGIPGELYERPWRNFGDNRSEALRLAKGHGDYIWVVDADDMLVGTPDFTQLGADAYTLRYRQGDTTVWRTRLFRGGLPWRYEGVVYEAPVCDVPYVAVRLEGEYRIEGRRPGTGGQDPQKVVREADPLLAAVLRDPEDLYSVVLLAQHYFDQGDFANARKWFARRLEMGALGPTEEVFIAMYRLAQAMARLGEPWPDVQDAYLRAWAFRQTRAEPLYAIAFHYQVQRQFQLGYLFAQRAAEIPLPDDDLTVDASVYAWSAVDVQAICASWIGKHAEAFTLCRRMLASPDTLDVVRQRITVNRDFSVPAMLEAASLYPGALAGSLVVGPRDAEVTVTLVAGPDREATELTLNSFLHCCTDVSRAGRFMVADTGLSAPDRTALQERYGFLEFVDYNPASRPADLLGWLREKVGGRLWLHLGQRWRFFAPENYITRLTAVLDAEPQVFQVGINYGDATKPTNTCATEHEVRRTPDAGRYVITDQVASGPAMFDTTRLDQAAAAGMGTASLDEVLCQGPDSQTATTVTHLITPADPAPPKIHRFCIAHTTPLIPETWYDTCIALGNYQTDSISHISQLDQYWHEARPIAYGAAGSYALPAAIEKFAPHADLIEISVHRKRILISPEGEQPGYLPAWRLLTVPECKEKTELATVITPPSDSGFLVVHPQYLADGIIGQYAMTHHFSDFLDYTSIAIEMAVLDNESAEKFCAENLFFGGGAELGIFPKSWLIPTLTQLERVGREFLRRHGNRIKTYDSYQVRAVGFLSNAWARFCWLAIS